MKNFIEYRPTWALITLSFYAAMAMGCGDDDTDAPIQVDAGMPQVDAGEQVQGPKIITARVTADPDNVLRATIDIETDTPTRLSVEVRGENLAPWSIPIADAPAMSHSIPVLGLRAETNYDFIVAVEDSAGRKGQHDELELETTALPGNVPIVKASVPLPAQVAPGFTLFDASYFVPGSPRRVIEGTFLLGVDNEGKLVWYQELENEVEDVRQLDNGNILYIADQSALIEMTMWGEEVKRTTIEDLGIDSFHHEIFTLPSGNFLTLSSDLRTIGGYIDEDGNPISYPVVGDVIIEFTPEGEVVQNINLFDLLDTGRIPSGFNAPFWDVHYQTEGTKDWTHGNALVVDPADGNYVISLRHQDWLLKIDRESGALIWTLGADDGDFTLVGEGGFAFHHHAPEYQEDGTILLYDNGNTRPPENMGDPRFSRVVEFNIDEEKMEVSQVWEYRGQTPFFTPAVGDADRLSNDNVMVVAGTLSSDPAIPFGTVTFARITEVTDSDPAEVVMEVTVDEPPGDPDYGLLTYRAERIKSLYPPL